MILDEQEYRGGLTAIPAPDAATLRLWSLVLSAVAIPHIVGEAPEEYAIWVAPAAIHAAQHQIFLYEEENRPQPDGQERYQDKDYFNPPTLLIMGLFVFFFLETGPWQDHSLWFASGAVNREAILSGHQWWRLLTALTLHADVVHLVGNVVLGGVIIHLLCKVLGTGLGWALIVMTGVSGNLVNVMLHRSQHLSVGFSTAVFGAVGLLCGLEMVRRRRWQGVLLALGAGLGLLAMLGTGGERVDLGAHLWGFVVGLVMGGVTSFGRQRAGGYPGFLLQAALFWSVLVLVWQAWRHALGFG
ncbi:MAG: rhomboid family intramembrane serine protease [Desulfurivibrionaceae bacterium]|nr:rhomboid family intramembrane serine protease [Desulfurivibrionaceae bacterium]